MNCRFCCLCRHLWYFRAIVGWRSGDPLSIKPVFGRFALTEYVFMADAMFVISARDGVCTSY